MSSSIAAPFLLVPPELSPELLLFALPLPLPFPPPPLSPPPLPLPLPPFFASADWKANSTVEPENLILQGIVETERMIETDHSAAINLRPVDIPIPLKTRMATARLISAIAIRTGKQ